MDMSTALITITEHGNLKGDGISQNKANLNELQIVILFHIALPLAHSKNKNLQFNR